MNQLNNQVVSIIRTFVPVLVGQVLTWLAAYGVLDKTGEISAALITLFTIIFTTAYYALIRWLETKFSSQFGWLLGVPKSPEYTEKK